MAEMTGPATVSMSGGGVVRRITFVCRCPSIVCMLLSLRPAPLSMGIGHLAVSKLETRETILSDDHGLWSGVRLDLIDTEARAP